MQGMPTMWSKLRWTVLEERGGHVEIMLNSESRRSNKRMIAEDSFDDTLHLCDMIESHEKNVHSFSTHPFARHHRMLRDILITHSVDI